MSTGEIVAIVEDRCLDDPIYKHADGNGSGDVAIGATVGVGRGAAAGHPPADPALANENVTLVRRGRALCRCVGETGDGVMVHETRWVHQQQ